MFRRVHAVIVAVGVGSAVRQRTTASGSVNGRGIPTRPMLAMASAAHIPPRSAEAAESMRSQGRIRRAPGKEGTGLSHQAIPLATAQYDATMANYEATEDVRMLLETLKNKLLR